MKLEELTKLGIPEETAKQVVEMNAAEISAEAKKLTDKEAELTMATDKIKELSETVKKFDGVDVEKLKSDLAAMEKKYSEDTAALKLENAINAALGGSGAKDASDIGKLLDRSVIKMDGDKLLGLTEQLEKLKTEKSYLFNAPAAENKPTGMTAVLGADHTAPAGNGGEVTLASALSEKFNV